MPSVRGGIFGKSQVPAGAPIGGDEVLVEVIVLVVVVVVEGSKGDTRGRIKILEPRVATDAVVVIVVIVAGTGVVGRAFRVSIVIIIIPVRREVNATNLVMGNSLSTAEASKKESYCKVLQSKINPVSFVEQFDFFRLMAPFDRIYFNRAG